MYLISVQASQEHILPLFVFCGLPRRRAASGKNGGEDGSGGRSASYNYIISIFTNGMMT
jgi:hypothetical protein